MDSPALQFNLTYPNYNGDSCDGDEFIVATGSGQLHVVADEATGVHFTADADSTFTRCGPEELTYEQMTMAVSARGIGDLDLGPRVAFLVLSQGTLDASLSLATGSFAGHIAGNLDLGAGDVSLKATATIAFSSETGAILQGPNLFPFVVVLLPVSYAIPPIIIIPFALLPYVPCLPTQRHERYCKRGLAKPAHRRKPNF